MWCRPLEVSGALPTLLNLFFCKSFWPPLVLLVKQALVDHLLHIDLVDVQRFMYGPLQSSLVVTIRAASVAAVGIRALASLVEATVPERVGLDGVVGDVQERMVWEPGLIVWISSLPVGSLCSGDSACW
jgi:hypothetical protein